MEKTMTKEERVLAGLDDWPEGGLVLPDHLDLPESDGTFVKNGQEHPQSILLTDAIGPVLERLYPEGNYFIGQDTGIYWKIPRALDNPIRSAVAPDWYLVPGRPPLVEGKVRRSYVMWYEIISPLVAIELASGDGSEERDRTEITGKFWIYEQGIRAPFYVIFLVGTGELEVHQLVAGKYQQMAANEHGHYVIGPLGTALGPWRGRYQNTEMTWLRWYDEQGKLLLIGREGMEREQAKVEKLMAQLRALGVAPDVANGG